MQSIISTKGPPDRNTLRTTDLDGSREARGPKVISFPGLSQGRPYKVSIRLYYRIYAHTHTLAYRSFGRAARWQISLNPLRAAPNYAQCPPAVSIDARGLCPLRNPVRAHNATDSPLESPGPPPPGLTVIIIPTFHRIEKRNIMSFVFIDRFYLRSVY